MLYVFMGPSCSGKSTVANQLKKVIGARIFTGRDYLRLAKDEAEAWKLFHQKLSHAALSKDGPGKSIIYVITEISQLNKIELLENAIKIKFTASLETLKSRFAERIRTELSPGLEKMLEEQHQEWENVQADLSFDVGESKSPGDISKLIAAGTR